MDTVDVLGIGGQGPRILEARVPPDAVEVTGPSRPPAQVETTPRSVQVAVPLPFPSR